jgi:hypothetical protein
MGPRFPLLILLFCGALLPAAGARAQPRVDDETRASARALGEEANRLFDAGSWQAALDKYERADALVHVPTLGVRAARCLVKLGRLVQAAERYLAVTRMTLPADALDVHKEALAQAEAERAALLPRIPALVVTLEGGPATVALDGKDLPPALLGAKRAIDPGTHELVARRGGVVQTRRVAVGEGETVPVAFRFDPGAPLAPAGPSADAPGGGQRVAGWTLVGTGAAGIAVGTITGLVALSKKGDLEGPCGGSDLPRCPPSTFGDADTYNAMRIASTVGFVVGGVAAAGGVVLLVTAPTRKASSARIAPWAGPTGGGATFAATF